MRPAPQRIPALTKNGRDMPSVELQLDIDKTIASMIYIVARVPGLTIGRLMKLLFLEDRAHLAHLRQNYHGGSLRCDEGRSGAQLRLQNNQERGFGNTSDRTRETALRRQCYR